MSAENISCEGCGELEANCCCDETIYYGDGDAMESFGCCLHDCIMPGYHFPSECHNAEMMEHLCEEFEAEKV